MNSKFLFPKSFKILGWLLFAPAFVAMVVIYFSRFELESVFDVPVFAIAETPLLSDPIYFKVIQNPILDELLLIALIVGGILVGFSRTDDEDEYIAKIRYESLIWAMYFNFGVMLFATVFFYGVVFFHILVANMFSMLLFFVLRFHLKLYQLKKISDYDQ
ncbi:MAG: hypothetical protein ITG00_09790 [Flavobacterium sp.]|nr:hypothetical protein [Flavobacterium sp.]